jgi:WD40 repeat protein
MAGRQRASPAAGASAADGATRALADGAAGTVEDTPDVFVSYAREDSAFVERLYSRLVASGRSAYVDTRGIPVWSPDWQAELYEAIEGADAFLFVLSEDALSSPNVALELRHAVEHGKRIKPLQIRDVDTAKLNEVDPAVRVPQWIDFRDDASFDARFDDLLEFLDTDVDWVRQHSRLGVRANEWERRRRERSLLLGRADLADAKAWLDKREGKEPQPTELQERYIEASIEDAQRRRRIRIGLGAAAGVVAAVLGTVALLQYFSASSSERTAQSRQLAAAAVSALSDDPADSLRLATRAVKVASTTQARSALRRALSQSFARAVLDPGPESMAAAVFSPDGRLVATSAFGGVRVWDARAFRQVARIPGSPGVSAMKFTRDGKRLVIAGAAVGVWDPRTGALIERRATRMRNTDALTLGPGGDVVAGSAFDGRLELWSTDPAELIALRRGHKDKLRGIFFSQRGDLVATASYDGTARVWNVADGELVAVLDHGDSVNMVAFSPDGRQAVTAGADDTAQLFDIQTGKRLHVLRGHRSAVGSVAYSPNGRSLLTTSLDHTARLWNATTGDETALLDGHDDVVWTGVFSGDGRLALTASADGTARVWETTSGVEVAVLRGHKSNVTGATFSPDGGLVLTSSDDGTARIWSPRQRDVVMLVQRELGPPGGVDFAPDGRRVLSAQGTTARIWQLKSREVRRVFHGRGRWLNGAVFSPDGRYVLSAASYGVVQLWETATGREVAVLGPPHQTTLSAAWFSPDGRQAVTTSADDTARLWRIPTGRPVAALADRDCHPTVASFSRDSSKVVTTCGRIAKIWRASDGELLTTLRGHADTVNAAAFSADGERVATAGADSVVRVWRAQDGKPERVIRGHRESVVGVSFSPDGRLLLTTSTDETARVWDNDGTAIAVVRRPRLSNAAFSPDGSYIMTTGSDPVIQVWESRTGESVQVFRGSVLPVHSAVFSPRGRMIASSSADRTVRVFVCRLCLPTDELVDLAERQLPRVVRPRG